MYTLQFICKNCGKDFSKEFEKGTDVDENGWYRTGIPHPNYCPKCGKIETIVYQDDIFSEIKTVFMYTIAHISLFSCIMMAILVVIDPQKPYIVATFILGLSGMILLMFKK